MSTLTRSGKTLLSLWTADNKEENKMKAKLAKLIDLKSIVTLVLTLVFCVLTIMGVIGSMEFMSIFTMVMTFYFCTQSQKKPDTTVGGYTGPQQSQALPQYVEPIYEAVNAADAQNIHPPDAELMAKVGFEY